MSLIQVRDLSFAYEGSSDKVFEAISFQIDSDWKLGLTGRNGRGKTTLLKLLRGDYPYEGSIRASVAFQYFPDPVLHPDWLCQKVLEEIDPTLPRWKLLREMAALELGEELLYRPFATLSGGEQTKLLLALLFLREDSFPLIDEPTNHLDRHGRDMLSAYLKKKRGFILVSHDRDLLDAVINHVLVLNRATIEVQAGNFSSWWENKEKSDALAQAENEKHLKEIRKLKTAADRSGRWAAKNENTKIGFDPLKEHDRMMDTRAFIGAKTKKMQARVKAFEKRIDREIEEKEGLLQDIEQVTSLKIDPLRYHKDVLVSAYDLSLSYEGKEPLFEGLRFEIRRGDRLVLSGANGCGKSSIISAVLERAGVDPLTREHQGLKISGNLSVGSGLIISYVSQDTSWLDGSLRSFAKDQGIDESLFLSLLRLMDFEREQFTKDIRDFSEGQKKKVLVAASLLTRAHLYIWDEPLNYIDVFSRMQIEKLILDYKPTMLLVEHDVRFQENTATKILRIGE